VSPDHALFIDGMLIPARLLVNGASIQVDPDCRWVGYYHIEFDSHDILLAEGLPAESYPDTGNRSMFENSGQPPRLHADFAGEQRLRETRSCAPFAVDAARVEPVWRALAGRAVASGWPGPGPAMHEQDLHVLCGKRRIDPLNAADGCYVFVLPDGDAPARLVSRTARPCDMRPWADDRRQIGVLVRRLTLRSGHDVREVALDGPMSRPGWSEVEWHTLGPCRWTLGDALLPPLGGCMLEVILGGTCTTGSRMRWPRRSDRRRARVSRCGPSTRRFGRTPAPV
jgi:antigen 43